MKKNLILTLFSYLIATFSFSQLNTNLLFNWDDPTIVGSTSYDNAYNECWGFKVNNTEIAVIGSTEGTHFFDVTDPQNSTEVAFVAGAYTGGGVVHRDYHDYQGYLYIVCDEGWSTSTLQIVDISNLPTSVNVVYDSDNLFNTSHNIFIDTATAKLYACASNTAMDIYSLHDPVNPTLLYSYTDVGHVHDAYVKNDTAYLNCGNDGFRIVDFSPLDWPVLPSPPYIELSSFTSYPDAGYNHSGWLSDDGTIYAMQDENHGYDVKIMDVSDYNNITVLSILNSGENAQSMAHNGIIKGDFLYLAYYHDGLRVFDISDPSNPVQVCNYDTYSPSSYNSYKGAWGVYPYLPSGNIIVSDMQTGLYIFDCSIPSTEINNLQDELSLYPNPSSSFISFKSNISEIQIYDLSGRIVLQKNVFSGEKISTNNLVNALYIYRLFDGEENEIENGKLIIE
jgi:choice-of-anchor B domain-containing protein